ncbi:hypothetical protein [Streptomyces carpinensis]|uniref:Uncharacterized protein n=1 Tax=Streptomyces carpinensis TaxID=66369 RepID=A0ABV1W5A7_9ACTN|nr:hypothetical protein [Streptomyces carpinensis]
MNIVCGKTLCLAASKAEEMFPWFVIMFGILVVALLVFWLKTRHH